MSEQATPQNEPQQFKNPKDKKCQYCGLAFTSSSLGRHLDLYVRARNPRTPDGKHNIEEIKKMRGGITRRQHKSSIKKEVRTPASNNKSVTGEDSPAPEDSPEDDDSVISSKPQSLQFPPPRTLGTKTPEIRRDASRQMQKVELDQRHKATDELDTAKATELALRELLKSVCETNTKITGTTLFDFDPYALTFPSLCLHILLPPSTLFSPTPFPTSESWSVAPPGQKQFDALNRQVRERLLAFERQRQINQMYPQGSHSNPASGNTSPLPTPPLFDPDPQKLFCHIADAYNHWTTQTEQHRQEAWQLEILRSYTRANDLRRETQASLEQARREIQHLKANRWSSGSYDTSPICFNLGTQTVTELGKLGMDFRNWDYDRLIDKWKNIVRENKTSGSGLAAQKLLPNGRSSSMISLPTPGFASVDGIKHVKIKPIPYSSAPPTTIGADQGSDQIDAEGEDDDADVPLDAEAASEDGSVIIHPNGLPHQPVPQHPYKMSAHTLVQNNAQFQQAHVQAQVQAQAQAQVQAQAQAQARAQAQAQAWAAARQHMNHSRNQHHPHPHQQLSPHTHNISAASSRRSSHAFIEAHNMNAGTMLPMEGIESHPDRFLRMGMLPDGFVGLTSEGV